MQAHRNHYTASMVMALLIFMSYHVFVMRSVTSIQTKQIQTHWKHVASFPGPTQLSITCSAEKQGGPGKIYQVRNVIGRENLITCGQTKELSHASFYMANRMGLDGTILHYLAVW